MGHVATGWLCERLTTRPRLHTFYHRPTLTLSPKPRLRLPSTVSAASVRPHLSDSHPPTRGIRIDSSIVAPRDPSSIDVDAGFRIDANATGRWKRVNSTHGIFVPSNPRAFVVVHRRAHRRRRRRCVQYPHPRSANHRWRDPTWITLVGTRRRVTNGRLDRFRFLRRHVWLSDLLYCLHIPTVLFLWMPHDT